MATGKVALASRRLSRRRFGLSEPQSPVLNLPKGRTILPTPFHNLYLCKLPHSDPYLGIDNTRNGAYY